MDAEQEQMKTTLAGEEVWIDIITLVEEIVYFVF